MSHAQKAHTCTDATRGMDVTCEACVYELMERKFEEISVVTNIPGRQIKRLSKIEGMGEAEREQLYRSLQRRYGRENVAQAFAGLGLDIWWELRILKKIACGGTKERPVPPALRLKAMVMIQMLRNLHLGPGGGGGYVAPHSSKRQATEGGIDALTPPDDYDSWGSEDEDDGGRD